jgi:hypothetical protein
MLRIEAKAGAIVLRHGDGPDERDVHGARDVRPSEEGGMYCVYMVKEVHRPSFCSEGGC